MRTSDITRNMDGIKEIIRTKTSYKRIWSMHKNVDTSEKMHMDIGSCWDIGKGYSGEHVWEWIQLGDMPGIWDITNLKG